MSIIAFKNTRVMIQGITGNAARYHTKNMLDYGTKIVAGSRPGAAGQDVHGVPVYDTVADAVKQQQAEASILFIPAVFVKDAAIEALSAGIKLLVIVAEHVPLHDAMILMEEKRKYNAIIIGPNTPGLISPPERTMLGFVPSTHFKPGNVGVMSRSGTLTYELVSRLTAAGIGQSTAFGVGGDRIIGTRFSDGLHLFENDPQTEAVLLVGEIGGTMEEEAADAIMQGTVKKPVFAYLAGTTAPSGTKLGHAGAIITGSRGTIESKLNAYAAANVRVAKHPADVVQIAKDILK
jgi:succinyl-CoA synthetase alpha subunit